MAKAKATKPVEKADINKYDKEIAKLIERGKKDSKIDQRDIFAAIPDTPADDVADDSVRLIPARNR
jgi:hypothetical protein